MNSEPIVLDPAQRRLLRTLVNARQAVPPGATEGFGAPLFPGVSWLTLYHPGLPSTGMEVHVGDINALADAGLIEVLMSWQGTALLTDVTPRGLEYYDAVLTPARDRVSHAG